MDKIQSQHERAVGDNFVSWYNQKNNTTYCFESRPREAPDLIYKDGMQILNLEIGASYYDSNDAKLRWQNARRLTSAPDSWNGENPDLTLLQQINDILEKKCAKDYGDNCFLIISIYPAITFVDELRDLIPKIKVPQNHFFKEIYIVGDFGQSSSGGPSGFHCFKL